MNWTSAADFWAMGGYAFYVWSSVLACALALLGENLLLRARRRQALRQLQLQRMAALFDSEESLG